MIPVANPEKIISTAWNRGKVPQEHFPPFLSMCKNKKHWSWYNIVAYLLPAIFSQECKAQF